MTTCLQCSHWQMRGSPEMAVLGFARCAIQEKWRFWPPQHVCKQFEQAEPKAVERRQVVLARLK